MEFNIPVILLKELVILPGQEAKIAVNNDISGSTINEASSKYKGEVLVVAPIDALEEEPSVDDLPSVGVVAKIKNKLDDGGQIYVRLKGIKRVVVQKYYQEKNKTILYSRVKDIDVVEIEKPEMEALKDKLFKVLKEYVDREKGVSNDIISLVSSEESFEKITDLIAAFLPFNTNKKLWYMQEVSADARAKSLIKDVNNAVVAARLDEELEEKVDERLQNDQRMYLLKEKMKVLKEELDEKSWKDEEVLEYKKILGKLKINKGIKEHLNREIEKYKIMADTAPEISVMHNYLETVLKLPWNKESKENANFVEVHKALDKSHFGLDTIKKRISEYVAIKNLNKNILPPIICLIGPPGVGKTSIASSIAKALNREFYKISVGGLNDSTELIGTRRTYLASSPGKIIQGINKCGVNNPLILIDEVDKMVKDFKGDPASVLLEILDPVQNKIFMDNYVEEPFDLSHVFFILTANEEENIPYILRDRLEIIKINSYTLFEKVDIAKNYILPKVLQDNVVYDSKIKFTDELLRYIINNYTLEAGVRDLNRVLGSLARKITIDNVKMLNESRVEKLLGVGPYTQKLTLSSSIGEVSLLSTSGASGNVTKLETLSFKGNGKVLITGQAGKILEESVYVVKSMLRDKYKYAFHNLDLHLHFLDASSRKNGPSAGVAIAVSLCSIMEKRIVPASVSFTGEISLTGKILPVGSVKEKLIAAYNMGVEEVFIPKENSDVLKDLPKEVTDKLTINLVSNFDEIYTKIFK